MPARAPRARAVWPGRHGEGTEPARSWHGRGTSSAISSVPRAEGPATPPRVGVCASVPAPPPARPPRRPAGGRHAIGMSLTVGTSPFGRHPVGHFNFHPDPPTGSVLFWDPVPYRLRGVFAGETVFDTTEAKLLHETGHLPVYYVPEEALRHDL